MKSPSHRVARTLLKRNNKLRSPRSKSKKSPRGARPSPLGSVRVRFVAEGRDGRRLGSPILRVGAHGATLAELLDPKGRGISKYANPHWPDGTPLRMTDRLYADGREHTVVLKTVAR